MNASYFQNQWARQPNGQFYVNFNVNHNIGTSQIPNMQHSNYFDDFSDDEYDDDDITDDELFDVNDDVWELPSQGFV